jgi:hypothetical protein
MLDRMQFKHVLALFGAFSAMLYIALTGNPILHIVLAPIGGVPLMLYLAYVVIRHHKLPMTATWGEVVAASKSLGS